MGIRHARQGEKENEEALEWLKKALLIAREKGTAGSGTVERIFAGMQFCWDREMCELEGIRWAYRNISREAAIDFMGIYSEPIRKKIREGFETGQIDFTDMKNGGTVSDKF